MLTKETMLNEDCLKNLTPSQVEAIEKLSAKDEEFVMKRYIGHIHSKYDDVVKSTLGLAKPRGVKTYKWLKMEVFPTIKQIFN